MLYMEIIHFHATISNDWGRLSINDQNGPDKKKYQFAILKLLTRLGMRVIGPLFLNDYDRSIGASSGVCVW